MDDTTKKRVATRLIQVLQEEGISEASEVLDLMREGVVGAVETIGHPSVDPEDKLDEIPQPYLGVVRAIAPGDIYLIVTYAGPLNFPARIVRIPKGSAEEKIAVAEKALVAPGRSVSRVYGKYLRLWVAEFARSQGHRLSEVPSVTPPKPVARSSKISLE